METIKEHFCRIEESHDSIKGFVKTDTGELFVIELLRNNDRWTVGFSMCLPSSIKEADCILECMKQTMKILDDNNENQTIRTTVVKQHIKN